MDGRALVLGGGGVTGVAWEIGLLCGLAERGADLTSADLVLGSSAGSLVGANVVAGRPLDDLYQEQLAAPTDTAAAKLGVAAVARMLRASLGTRDPVRARARIGRMALAAKTEPEAGRRTAIAAWLPVQQWPDRQLRVTAVDAGTGELAVFDAASGVTLADAVGASCAVPGVWPPVSIAGRRFIDGGIRSPANADLAAGFGRVVIVAPITRGLNRAAGVRRQAAALTRAGARVVVLEPDPAAARAIGRNVLDSRRRAGAARAGLAQGLSAADRIAVLWLADEAAAEPP